MHFQSIHLSLGFILSLTSAIATALETRAETKKLNGLPIVPMKWTGEVSNGHRVTIDGSIQEVYAQIIQLEPNFNINTGVVKKRGLIDARTPVFITCDIPQQPAHTTEPGGHHPLEDAIRYLKSLSGTCSCPAHSCVRISCSYNDAVYMCNDNDGTIAPRCDYQGSTMVQSLVDQCTRQVDNGVFAYTAVKGKIWDSENYSITVQQDSC